MYKAMVFYSCPFGSNTSTVRSVRIKPFKTKEKAIEAIESIGEGYILKVGQKIPIWNNVAY